MDGSQHLFSSGNMWELQLCAQGSATPPDCQIEPRFGYVVNIQELNVRERAKLQVQGCGRLCGALLQIDDTV